MDLPFYQNQEKKLYELVLSNHIDDIVCDDIIEKFEADQTKGAGLIGNPGRVDETIKKSIDLRISTTKEEWSDVDNYLYKKLGEGFQNYIKYLEEMLGEAWTWTWAKSHFEHTSDTGYQIQRVDKGGFYVWHNDHNPKEKRELACIVYLNTLTPDDGGSTDFMIGTTTADISIHCIVDFLQCWRRVLFQKCCCCHDLPRLAVATLGHIDLFPCLLYRVISILGKSFNRRNF